MSDYSFLQRGFFCFFVALAAAVVVVVVGISTEVIPAFLAVAFRLRGFQYLT